MRFGFCNCELFKDMSCPLDIPIVIHAFIYLLKNVFIKPFSHACSFLYTNNTEMCKTQFLSSAAQVKSRERHGNKLENAN